MADGESRYEGKIEEFQVKKFYYPAIIAVLITGCSSTSTVSNVESNASNKSVVSNVQVNSPMNQAVNLPTSQTNAVSSTNMETLPNVNAGNSMKDNPLAVQNTSLSRENLEKLKSKGHGDKNAAPIIAATPTPNPAPDNSELSSTMNAKGVPIETRVFKNNPTLAKIEKTFEDLNNPVTKVYLKNGKVLTVPKGSIPNSEAATADEILRAVGVKP